MLSLRSLFRRWLLRLALVSITVFSRAAVPQIPVEVFFGSPEITHLKFSPNGRYLAALVPVDHRMNLMVVDLEKMSKELVTRLSDEGIVDYLWANDDRLLFYRDEGGKESYGLYGVKRTGGVVDRLAYRGEDSSTASINVRFAGLLHRDPKNADRCYILANETVRDRPDIASMNVRSGKYQVVTRNPGFVSQWVIDGNNVARFGITDEQGKYSVLYREKAGEEWKKLGEFSEDGHGWVPLGFDRDNRTVYVASNLDRKTSAVFKYDTATHQFISLVCADETYDAVGPFAGKLLYDSTSRAVIGIRYEADKPRIIYWDPEYARRQAIIDRALPGLVNEQIGSNMDGSRVVVFSASDREPGFYSLFDAKRKKIEELAVLHPAIDPEKMAPVQPISFQARDGLLLHGYLTIPVGAVPKNLPLIIYPHGGPYGPRDVWGYDPEIQFWANRGLAVLQVNFRGSGGYGLEFQQAGYRQWGRAMQDDLTDGVRWAIAKGIADPARVAISGASYGGYATMAGLALTPELYCAGINYVGVTDLELFAERYNGDPEDRRWFRLHVGDVDRDRSGLKATSPVNLAERIQVPVLMAYGRNDPRVDIEHCYAMERALKRAGKKFEMVIAEDEGHGFRKEEAAIKFFRLVDEFLRKNVRAGAAVAAAP